MQTRTLVNHLVHLPALAGALGLTMLMANPGQADDVSPGVAAGERTYKQFCTHCHGAKMVNAGTGSFDLRKFPVDEPQRFVRSIMDGKGDMPAWGDVLLAEEIEALWAYVSSRGGKVAPVPIEPLAEQHSDAADAASDPVLARDIGLVSAGKLTACLAQNGSVMSAKRVSGGTGIDYFVLELAADQLGLEPQVLWFETEQEDESNPIAETAAMLSKGLCDFVPSYALTQAGLRGPMAARATPPFYPDRPDHERHKHVDLKPLDVTAPYTRTAIGLVYMARDGRDAPDIQRLDNHVVGLQQGTLSGEIMRAHVPQRPGMVVKTRPPGPAFLWEMEAGLFDTAIIDIALFDFHKRQNALTDIILTNWRHPYSVNIAAAVLRENAALKLALDAVIQEIVDSGALAARAAENGLHYHAPKPPLVAGPLRASDLRLQ